IRRRGPCLQRVGYLPDIRGRRGVERDERGQFDQGVAAWVQAAPRLPFGPQFQARSQKVVVAPGQATQRLLGGVVDFYLGWRGHGQGPFGRNADGSRTMSPPWRLLRGIASP